MRQGPFFNKLIGSTKGIRIHPKIDLNNINNLQSESIGSQHLLLRHLALGQSSLLEFRALKIASICGLLCEKLLTAGMAAGPILVSLSPVFSIPPDCAEKVRRR